MWLRQTMETNICGHFYYGQCYGVYFINSYMLLVTAISGTPGLRRYPSRHLRATALRLEIKLATAPGREAQKEPCEPPSPRRIHIRILKPRCSGHTWGGKKGREKRKGGEENKEEKRTAQPHHQSLHSSVWSPISPIKLRCSGPTGLTCIIRG